MEVFISEKAKVKKIKDSQILLGEKQADVLKMTKICNTVSRQTKITHL